MLSPARDPLYTAVTSPGAVASGERCPPFCFVASSGRTVAATAAAFGGDGMRRGDDDSSDDFAVVVLGGDFRNTAVSDPSSAEKYKQNLKKTVNDVNGIRPMHPTTVFTVSNLR